MANDGVVTYGADLQRAYLRMEAVEHYAKIVQVARELGNAPSLDRREEEKLTDLRVRYGKNGQIA